MKIKKILFVYMYFISFNFCFGQNNEIGNSTYKSFRRLQTTIIEAEGPLETIKIETDKINVDPNETSYSFRGLAKLKLQDYRGAIIDFAKAIEICKKEKGKSNSIGQHCNNYYYYSGLARIGLEDYFGAKSDFNLAIFYNTNDDEAYFQRGIVRIKLKELNEGCLDLSKAGELGNSQAYVQIKNYCAK